MIRNLDCHLPFDKRVEAQIRGLPTGMLARFLRHAERVELFGSDLSLPHTPRWLEAFSNYGSKRRTVLPEIEFLNSARAYA